MRRSTTALTSRFPSTSVRADRRWRSTPAERVTGSSARRDRAWSSTASSCCRRWLVSSEPDEHIDQLRPYLELGFRHLVFHHPGEDQSRFIELYSKQILPRLRKEFDS